jgi:excisionase family DNA binding protein
VKLETPLVPVDTQEEELLCPKEVAPWLGVSAAWVRDHATRKSPRLPAIKVGRLLRFRRAQVREFLHGGSSRERFGPSYDQL